MHQLFTEASKEMGSVEGWLGNCERTLTYAKKPNIWTKLIPVSTNLKTSYSSNHFVQQSSLDMACPPHAGIDWLFILQVTSFPQMQDRRECNIVTFF